MGCNGIDACLVAFLLGAAASAQTTWDGSESTSWNEPLNWDTGTVPSGLTNVVIAVAPNAPATYTANPVCNDLTINTGATMLVASGFQLAVGGNLVVEAGGTLTTEDTSSVAGNVQLTGSGASLQTDQPLTVGGEVELYPGAVWDLGGQIHTVSGNWRGRGGSATSVPAGTIEFDGSGFFITQAGTIDNVRILSGTWSVQNVNQVGYSIGDPLTQVSGDLEVVGGTLQVLISGGLDNTSRLTVGGNLTLDGSSAAVALNLSSGSNHAYIEVAGAFSSTLCTASISNSTTIECAGDWTSDASFAPTGGLVLMEGGGLVTMTAPSLSSLELSAGTQTTLATTAFTNGGITLRSGAELTLTAAATLGQGIILEGGALLTSEQPLALGGSVSLASGSVWDLGGQTHTVAGNWNGQGGSATSVPAGTIEFDGTGSFVGATDNVRIISGIRSIGNGGNSLTQVSGDLEVVGGTLRIDVPGIGPTARLTVGGNLTLDGSIAAVTLFLSTGHPDTRIFLEVAGSFSSTLSTAIIGNNSCTIECAGDWTSDASFAPTSGVVLMEGGGPVTMTAPSLSSLELSAGTQTTLATTAFTNGGITLRSGAELTLTSAATLGQGITLEGSATLTSEQPLALGGNVDLYSGSAWDLGGQTHMVAGNWHGRGVSATSVPAGTIEFVGSGYFVTQGGTIDNVRISSGTRSVTEATGAADPLAVVSGDLEVVGGTLRVLLPGIGHTARLTVGGNLTLDGSSAAVALVLSSGHPDTGIFLEVAGDFSSTLCTTSITNFTTIECDGDWTSDASFDASGGIVRFVGSGSQSVSLGGASLFNVEVVSSSATTITDSGTVQGSLTVTGSLTVDQALDVDGSLTASGGGSSLSFAGAGTVVDGSFSAAGSVEVDGSLELNGTASFQGTLSGTGLVDCDANVTLQAASTLAPSFNFAQNVTVYSSVFAPTTGCAVFDGTSTQTVTQASGAAEIVFACLEIESQASVDFLDDLHVTGATLWDGEGSVSGDARFDGSFEGTDVNALLTTGASKNVEWQGDVIKYAGILEPGGIIYITTSGSVTVDVPQGFGVLVNVGITGTLTIENATLALGGDLVIQSGTVVGAGDLALTIASPHEIVIEADGVLDAQGNLLLIVDDAPISGVPITVEGRLEVGAGGELALAASTIDVQAGGVLSLVGASPDSRAAILGAPLTGGGWQVEIGAGATLEAHYFLVQQMGTGGIDVDIGASLGAFPLDLRDGIFDRIAANGVYLEIDRSTPTQLDDLQFLDSSGVGHANQPGTFNVRVGAASQVVSFEGWSGSFGGPQFEDDASGLALWGSRLDYLIVRERLTRNDVFWRTVFEDDVLSFHVERAPDLGGSFVQVGPDVTPVGPSVYSLTDSTITPATGYRYRLREVLWAGPPEISKVLRTVRTNGVQTPASRPSSGLPNPPVLARPGGSSGGKPGKLRKAPSLKGDPDAPDAPGRPGDPDLQATLDDALASASSGWIDVVLAAGRHAPFTFEPTGRQNLRIVGLDGEPAVVDVSEAPIRIRGVGRRQSVELSGFALSSDDSRRPAIVIENCEGLVLLDGLEVRGRRSSGVRLVNAAAVVLQDVKLPELAGLELERGSNAWCRRGQLQELRLSEGSRVESWGTQARSVVDATSEWRRHPAMAAQLGLEQVEGDLVVTVAGAPESAWLGLVSLHLARELAPGAQPMLLYRPMPLGPARALGPDGRDQLVLPVPPSIALLGGPAYLQALLSTEGGQALTPVRSWRPGQGD